MFRSSLGKLLPGFSHSIFPETFAVAEYVLVPSKAEFSVRILSPLVVHPSIDRAICDIFTILADHNIFCFVVVSNVHASIRETLRFQERVLPFCIPSPRRRLVPILFYQIHYFHFLW